MEKWKFLLLGVTGDLASKKILPGISQFAQINEEKVKISFIGYSRSKPEEQNIIKILNEGSTTGKHFLSSISFLQGQYDDPAFFGTFIDSLDEDETGVIYMAVPPNVFLDFLKTSCPYSKKKIHILVEKPFGRDIQEAQEILDLVKACTLGDKVHFTDHYYFKSQSILEKGDLLNLKPLQSKEITRIEVSAIEKLGIEGRVGYFENVGSLKDMLPHLLSLTTLALDVQKGVDYSDFFQNYKVKDVRWGQYKSYLKDGHLSESKTETYFKVEAETTSGVEIIFESGKKLGQKKTQIKIFYSDESELIWRIDPEKNLDLISHEQVLTLNLDRNKKLDHTNLFENLLNGIVQNFVQPEEILLQWRLYQGIINFKNSKYLKPDIYKDSHYPVQAFVPRKKSGSEKK